MRTLRNSILLATTNAGKIREIRLAFAGVPVALTTLADHEGVAEPEETEATFTGNARLKAIYYRARFGGATLAEDSGLVIDALGGRPGVESARYPGATYVEKFANLYRELAPHPRPWTARFVSVVAFAADVFEDGRTADTGSRATPDVVCFEGVVEGEIAPVPRGDRGFGYDPIFYVPTLSCTTSEMTDSQKLEISHRGQALRRFRAWFEHCGTGALHR